MIIVHAFVEVKSGAADEFVKAAAICVEETHKESGNNFYTLYTEALSPLKFIVVEEWSSKSALDEHMQTPHFIKFGLDIENLLAAPLEVKVY
ncbi:MAG: antibiotic biosynthesis monooxygenase, partial [Firmicutes bacterium]|nr:antibiotic biosynthesis monooxygenase [Bacillota bacterium]